MLDLLHEPRALLTLSDDPQGWLAASLAIPLLNHHLRMLAEETKIQIADQLRTLLAPQLRSGGSTAQFEERLWKGFSATFSVGGMWSPPRAAQPGRLDWSTNSGLTLHLEGF